MKHERFSWTVSAWAWALILVPLWGGRAQAGFFTALAQFEGQSNSTEPVSVSKTFDLGNPAAPTGVASAAASASHGSAAAMTQKIVFPGHIWDDLNIRADASFTISDLVFSGAAPGQQFNASLNYELSGDLDLRGMNTTGGVNVSLRVASFFINNFHDAGSFGALHSLHDFGQIEEGEWVISRTGTLSSFATGAGEVAAMGGNTATPTLFASDALLLKSSPFLLVANNSGVVGSPSITLSLTSGVGGPRFRNNHASSTSDFGLTFAASGPVFNLPDGITVNSTDGLIVNNQFVGGPAQVNPVPEPSSLVLLGIGALALLRGARRPTRILRAVRALRAQ